MDSTVVEYKRHIFHDFRSIKRFSIYGLEVSSGIWSSIDEFTLTLDILTIFNEGNPKVTSFNLAEEAHQKEQNKKKKSQEHYFDYKLAPFCWDWLNKRG